jgi:predicted porin
MKKLPLVLALSAASICTLTHAQSVQVYGKFYPYVEQESASGQTAVGTPVSTLAAAPTGTKGIPTVKGMSAGNSNIGLRGQEDLGGGLKGEFQIEGVVAVDNGNSAGFTWGRNGFVGLQGGFGEIRLGIMDTVFKEYGDTLGILGISSGTPVSSSNVLRKTGFGTSNNGRFHERRPNTIRYDSPSYGGIQGGLQIATQENPTATVGAAKTYSMGLKYDNGPIYVALAYEIHDNFFGGSSSAPTAQRNNGATDTVTSHDTALQATVEWRITKDQKVEFDVINKNYDENAVVTGRFQNYKNTAYMVAYDGRFDAIRVMAHYVKSGAGSCSRVNAVCTTTGLEGSQLTAGVAYNTSRRTYVYAAYTKIGNGVSARFAATDLGGVPNAGESSRHLIAGVAHSF